MRIINWNISWSNNVEDKITYLRNLVNGKSFIVILQEVKPFAYEAIKNSLLDIANIEYSLNYRIPSKFDTDSRKLGVAILISKDFVIANSQILPRSLMPDRTIMVDLEYNGKPFRVLGLHSITGCHHLKAKEMQFDWTE